MSYTPTQWATGDTVTAEKLNKMEGGIAAAAPTDPFIVNLTPTAQDMSGVMDATVAEINEAYEAGYRIVFRAWMSETSYMDTDCTARWHNTSTYPSFNGYIFTDTPISALLFAFTGTTNDGTKSTYGTTIYPLTPMS